MRSRFILMTLSLLLLAACNNEATLSTAEVEASVAAAVAATENARNNIEQSLAQTVTAQVVVVSSTPVKVAEMDTATSTSPVLSNTEGFSTGVPELTPTPATNTSTPPPTNTPIPTATATNTPEPPTNTPEPTETPIPPTNTPAPAQPTSPPPPPPDPTTPPNPVYGGDILPNSSFEEGWYNMWGVSELQLPNGWVFEWDEGPTGFGSEEWDQWYRPETRVLPYFQLSEKERGLLIQDGDYTLKIFKGYGPISFRMFRDVTLEPGTYKLTIRAYPDLVMDYDNGRKIWASPGSGEVRFITPDGGSNWILPTLGNWNAFEHTFTLAEPATVRLGAGFRARYGLANNGWFIDNWDLQRLEGS